jgi:hypothetical protein
LNTENVQYRIFNTIEYRKKFQYRTSIVPKKKINKNPRPIYEVIIDSVPTMGYQPNRCWVKNWKQISGLRGQITVANE